MVRKKRRKIKKWILGIAAVFLVLSMAGCTAAMSVGSQLIDKGKVKNQSESSVIFDKDGKEITKLYADVNREYVDFSKIPDIVKKAFVDTEDERFYQHNGVDFLGIARAVYKDIRAGGAVEGASTITQQLAKNVYLTNTKSIWRKTEEALIAINLERNYSKDQILEFYLNEIYFGHGAYGVQAASKFYFGKDVSQLNLAEAATLAGMPKAPNTYAPIPNYDKSVERRKTVLTLMVRNGTITQQQADTATKEQLKLANNTKNNDDVVQTYIDYALQEAEDKYGLTEDQIYRGGYEIYTALDMKAQKAMADAFNNPKLFPDSKSKDPVQAAMVIIDPHTGGIVAMTGGRDYVPKGLNRVESKRNPGSTFKPLAVYGPALEEGWHSSDLLKDEKMTFPGGYSPSNWYGDGYTGQVSMSEALKRSKNVPAVWLLNELGMDTSFRYLSKFGIPYDKKTDRKLGIALGDIDVTPLNMAKGYSAFDNKGIILEPHVITKIKDNGGNVKEADVNSNTAVSEQTANTMTSMLIGVVNDGTGKQAQMNRPVAGKTGTTQMPGTNGNRDAWFVGYTPEYVAAVWMGYDKSDASTNYLRQGSEVPAHFFSVVMTEALRGREVKPFPKQEQIEDTPTPQVQTPTVQDLKAEQLQDSIHFKWTVADDNHFTYRIYRYADDPNKKQVIGETQKGEWIDLVPKLDQALHYYVVAFDSTTKQEGPSSNVIEVRPKTLQAPDVKSPTTGNTGKAGQGGTQPGTKKDGKTEQQQPTPPTQDSGTTTKPIQPPTPGKTDNNKGSKIEPPTTEGNTKQQVDTVNNGG
ncbi:MAG TPA: PBP1A family penicillin-binding protein [Bacillota bacterium]|nr:PBP1A family penicillin-binding protein [Bacillota bacterium]